MGEESRCSRYYQRTSLEDWLNFLTASIFLGALIYFLVQAEPFRVPLGDKQSFCSCSPSVSITLISNGALCLVRANPSNQQQLPSQYFDFFYNGAGIPDPSVFTTTNAPLCSNQDVPSFSFSIGSKSLVLDTTSMKFTCFVYKNTTTESSWTFVNITDNAPLIGNPPHNAEPTNIMYFKSPTFDFATIRFDEQPYPGAGASTDWGARECILFMDARDWSSSCSCPLSTIGDAVAVASVTALLLFPLRLFRIFRPPKKTTRHEVVTIG